MWNTIALNVCYMGCVRPIPIIVVLLFMNHRLSSIDASPYLLASGFDCMVITIEFTAINTYLTANWYGVTGALNQLPNDARRPEIKTALNG